MIASRRSFLVGAAAMMLMRRPAETQIAPLSTAVDPTVELIVRGLPPMHVNCRCLRPGQWVVIENLSDGIVKVTPARGDLVVSSMSPGDTGGQ